MEKTVPRHREGVAPDAPSFERNAPPMGRDFDAARNAEKDRYLAQRAAESRRQAPEQDNQRIATRAELDQRRAARAKPAPALELNMDGSIRQSIDRNEQAGNEKEIYLLERQLEARRNEPTREFTRNR